MSSVVVREHAMSYSRVSFDSLWRDVYNVISSRIRGMITNINDKTNEIKNIVNELSKVDAYKNILNNIDDVEITTGYALEFNRNHRDKIVLIIRTETIDVWIEYDYID